MKPINEMSLAELAEFFDDDERIAIRLRELHDLTRWIPVEERLPTKGDADERGNVLWLFWGKHYESRYWYLRRDYGMTHWRRIDKPEGV